MRRTIISASAILVLVLVSLASETAGEYNRVLLSEVQVLTFFRNRDTTARRTTPIPQLKCIGDHQLCQAKYLPSSVQCTNAGWDGFDVQWECKGELDSDVAFDAFHVSCEGFQGPDDAFVLDGSCGLEYKLKFTNSYNEKKRAQDELIAERRRAAGVNSQGASYTSNDEDSGWGFKLFFLGCAIVFALIWCTKKSNRKLAGTTPTPTPTPTPTSNPRYSADPSYAYGQAPSAPSGYESTQTTSHTYSSADPTHIINEQHVTSHTFLSSTPPAPRTTTGYTPPSTGYTPPSTTQTTPKTSDKSVHMSTGFATTTRR